MSREISKGDGPYGRLPMVYFARVDKQHRLRLPSRLGLIVPWLGAREERVECLALIGPKGGLVIAPETALGRHGKILARLSKLEFSYETSREVMEYARFSATNWAIYFLREPSRYAFTLPEEARKLGLAPSSGRDAAIFVAGQILEVWPAEKWLDHIRELASDLDGLQTEVLTVTDDEDDT